MALNGLLKVTASASDSKSLPLLKAQSTLNWTYLQMLTESDQMTVVAGTLDPEGSTVLNLTDGSLLDQFGDSAVYTTLTAIAVRNSGSDGQAELLLQGSFSGLGSPAGGVPIPIGGAALFFYGGGVPVAANENIVIENPDTQKNAAYEVLLFGEK
ncbi:MAG TPA: hypothetical protein PLX18_11480 [Anaerohalosphaeraceae bacterium]|nr:hypothetical protein [Anaerohalosphaeraceae bacterium]HQG06844.1 hypothetical protein [Anaerohalosphaeraceae bacterium]HQI08463.1 hypothetical protein [Anaerohalosphaeraceae bacterium]HQJ68782.1 hypothetical protein [Anaerohalosphaeraceae bacterium]